eukprot:SAG22_NODE_232_length_14402_cov_58.042159_8_plen_770_part_00
MAVAHHPRADVRAGRGGQAGDSGGRSCSKGRGSWDAKVAAAEKEQAKQVALDAAREEITETLEDDNAIDIKRKETNIEETQKGEEDEEFLEEETLLFEEIVEKCQEQETRSSSATAVLEATHEDDEEDELETMETQVDNMDVHKIDAAEEETTTAPMALHGKDKMRRKPLGRAQLLRKRRKKMSCFGRLRALCRCLCCRLKRRLMVVDQAGTVIKVIETNAGSAERDKMMVINKNGTIVSKLVIRDDEEPSLEESQAEVVKAYGVEDEHDILQQVLTHYKEGRDGALGSREGGYSRLSALEGLLTPCRCLCCRRHRRIGIEPNHDTEDGTSKLPPEYDDEPWHANPLTLMASLKLFEDYLGKGQEHLDRKQTRRLIKKICPNAKNGDLDAAMDSGPLEGDEISVHHLHEWLASKKILTWKGVVMESYESSAKSRGTWRHLLLTGPFQSHSLPAMTLENLGSRLGTEAHWRSWFGGGGLITLLAIWSVAAPSYIAGMSQLWSFVALGVYYAPLVGILLLFLYHTSSDIEWTDIDDFMDHRTVRWNKENTIACVSQFTTLLQLVALTVRVMPNSEELTGSDSDQQLSSYDEFKDSVKKMFDLVLFQFDIIEADVDYFLLSVVISIVGVAVWWLAFGGLLLNIAMNCGADSRAVQARFKLYQTLRRGGGAIYYLFSGLSDILMISIMSNLMKTMDCTFDQHGVPTLDANPDYACWGVVSEGADVCFVSQCSSVEDDVAAECASNCTAGVTDGSQQFLATLSLVRTRATYHCL